MAVWGNKTDGVIHPVSYRGLYVIGGSVLMIAAFLWMLSLKSMDKPGLQSSHECWPNPHLNSLIAEIATRPVTSGESRQSRRC